jgi:hypothetical protein
MRCRRRRGAPRVPPAPFGRARRARWRHGRSRARIVTACSAGSSARASRSGRNRSSGTRTRSPPRPTTTASPRTISAIVRARRRRRDDEVARRQRGGRLDLVGGVETRPARATRARTPRRGGGRARAPSRSPSAWTRPFARARACRRPGSRRRGVELRPRPGQLALRVGERSLTFGLGRGADGRSRLELGDAGLGGSLRLLRRGTCRGGVAFRGGVLLHRLCLGQSSATRRRSGRRAPSPSTSSRAPGRGARRCAGRATCPAVRERRGRAASRSRVEAVAAFAAPSVALAHSLSSW